MLDLKDKNMRLQEKYNDENLSITVKLNVFDRLREFENKVLSGEYIYTTTFTQEGDLVKKDNLIKALTYKTDILENEILSMKQMYDERNKIIKMNFFQFIKYKKNLKKMNLWTIKK